MKRSRALFDRWTAWSPVLLLGALGALTFWLDAQVQVPDGQRKREMRHDPDLFMQNFRALSFDAQGRVKQSLTAQRAEHHPDDESVDFVAPALVITDAQRPKLTVTADAGTLSGNRETVIFRGNVHATREPLPSAEGEGVMKLSTDFLRVLPNQGIAETDRPVTIEEGRGIIHATGITLDNQTRSVKMKSGVRGTMQPEAPK